MGALVLAVSLTIAREKRLVFGAALAYIAVQSLFGISISRDLNHAAVFAVIGLVAGITLFGLMAHARSRKVSYDSPTSPADYTVSAVVFAGLAIGVLLIPRDSIRFCMK